jgi:hypothetical protein|tara:strand:- start:1095 stop:1862 length:768 start_codon:yes stop_codon:yes gene_type:complete
MPMSQLHNIIQDFRPIGLDEMDSGTKLMNRVDTKFVLNVDHLIEILPQLKEEYRILEIQGVRFPSYESEYFDDKKLTFYIDHHRKKVDRYKVRYRKYIESNIAFLEVKHKKKGRTDKQRIKVDDLPGRMSKEDHDFVKSTGVPLDNLELVLTNKFSRITFVGINHNERLTFDINLSFFKDDKEIVLSNLVIAELKQARVIRNSPFYAIMKGLLVRPFRISKYCIGIIELYGRENVKYNRFKKKLLKINKLRNNVA